MHLSFVPMVALTTLPLALAQSPAPPAPPAPPGSLATPGTLATSIAPAIATVSTYPIVQILPVPGWNTTKETFNSLANLYLSSAAELSAQVVIIAQRNVELSGSGAVQYSYEVQASLASSLSTLNNMFWQTAIQAEQKVCAITTSISQQNVDSVKGNLLIGVTAEAQAVVSIAVTLKNTVAAVQSQITRFSDAERAVLSTLIAAIATAASASITPITTLNAGLRSTGINALDEVTRSLQSAVESLKAAATINWTIE